MSDLGWWIIHGDELLTALREVELGESADLVYAELYANCFTSQGDENAEKN